jgi:beta-aspartyl-dipeptidase (metallo-type)
MITLLKNVYCFGPKPLGMRDILICGDRIYKLRPEIGCMDNGIIERIYYCDGLLAFPGIIDQHLHIIGGGGESGFDSLIAEINADDILKAGVTTVVGLLGADRCSKRLEALYAKSKALERSGLTSYIYSGSYSVPPVTITSDIMHDLVYIDKVIGVKIALSDHRASHPGIHELLRLASDAHLGGMLSGKAGVVHIHIGDGKAGLDPLPDILNRSELDKGCFVPTHLNRNPKLFSQAKEYCRAGGNIDLTAGETAGISVPDAVAALLSEGADVGRVTVSSDANGSVPGGGISSIGSLYRDVVGCIRKGVPPETAFGLVTENVAGVLKLHRKGRICEGGDADILVTDKNYEIKMLFSKGRLLVKNN